MEKDTRVVCSLALCGLLATAHGFVTPRFTRVSRVVGPTTWRTPAPLAAEGDGPLPDRLNRTVGRAFDTANKTLGAAWEGDFDRAGSQVSGFANQTRREAQGALRDVRKEGEGVMQDLNQTTADAYDNVTSAFDTSSSTQTGPTVGSSSRSSGISTRTSPSEGSSFRPTGTSPYTRPNSSSRSSDTSTRRNSSVGSSSRSGDAMFEQAMSMAVSPLTTSGKFELLRVAAASDRGRFLSGVERARAEDIIIGLEEENPTKEPAMSPKLQGVWRLVYSGSEDPTRSSPFFWAFRQVCGDVPDFRDRSKKISEAIFSVTDSLPFKDIGPATQTIKNGFLISEVQVVIGKKAMPWFFPSASAVMTTESRINADADPAELNLSVLNTFIAESTLQRLLPALSLDQIAFPTGEVFDQLKPRSSTVRVKVTYLDDDFRVVRDREGRAFVYTKVKGA